MSQEERDVQQLNDILERNPHLVSRLSIHPMRWRLLAAWMAIFTILVFFTIRQNREAISSLNDTKASVIQLQNTNCALRGFLLSARNTRLSASKTDKDPERRRIDIAAAAQYTRLAKTFDGHSCRKGGS